MSSILTGYDRVTDCLRFVSGMDKVPPQILKNASGRGTRVHDTIDIMIKEGLEISEPNEQGYIDSFKLWAEGKVLKPSPGRFYCDKYMITGEIDSILMVDGIPVSIIDFKTSYKPSNTWCLQAAAYKYLAKVNGIELQEEPIFLLLDKFGKYPQILQYEDQFDMYVHVLHVYRRYFKNKAEDINIDDI